MNDVLRPSDLSPEERQALREYAAKVMAEAREAAVEHLRKEGY